MAPPLMKTRIVSMPTDDKGAKAAIPRGIKIGLTLDWSICRSEPAVGVDVLIFEGAV